MSGAVHRAATVLVLRSTGSDVEVLLVRRGQRASFMANAYVFPGGRVDPADSQADPALTTRRCALRELREETALHSDDPTELVYFGRWITPAAEPRRFDTDFFLWSLPPDQTPSVDGQEVFDPRWYTPRAALADYEAGLLNLPPPTACTLEELAAELAVLPANRPALAGLLAAAGARQPTPLKPKLHHADGGGLQVVMPWDPDFATLDGDGVAASGLAPQSAAVRRRICRCSVLPSGGWRIERLPV
jgi:8-oxo-dGTP pyrophosphatase MutT (NUDIX family)